MANERERERTKSLNAALEALRFRLPVAEAEKRSKIQTLRTAKEYIRFLAERLREHEEDLKRSATSQLQPQQQQQQIVKNNNQSVQQSTKQQAFSIGNSCAATDLVKDSQDQPDSSLTYKFYKFRVKCERSLDR